MQRIASSGVIVLVLSWTIGCTSQTAKAPPLVKVSGTVKLDNKDMDGGEVRFTVSGFPPKVCEIKEGKFSGEAHTGKNTIEIVWDKEEGASATDPKMKMKINIVDPKFSSGANSPLNAEITEDKTFEFKVTSVRK